MTSVTTDKECFHCLLWPVQFYKPCLQTVIFLELINRMRQDVTMSMHTLHELYRKLELGHPAFENECLHELWHTAFENERLHELEHPAFENECLHELGHSALENECLHELGHPAFENECLHELGAYCL